LELGYALLWRVVPILIVSAVLGKWRAFDSQSFKGAGMQPKNGLCIGDEQSLYEAVPKKKKLLIRHQAIWQN
jgi:hypothetical protein